MFSKQTNQLDMALQLLIHLVLLGCLKSIQGHLRPSVSDITASPPK